MNEYADYDLNPEDSAKVPPKLLPASNGVQLNTMRELQPTDAPHKLGYGMLMAIEQEPWTTFDRADIRMNIVVSGGKVPLKGVATWGDPGGKEIKVYIFEWNAMYFAALLQGPSPMAEIWGPFESVEAAHKVITLL